MANLIHVLHKNILYVHNCYYTIVYYTILIKVRVVIKSVISFRYDTSVLSALVLALFVVGFKSWNYNAIFYEKILKSMCDGCW